MLDQHLLRDAGNAILQHIAIAGGGLAGGAMLTTLGARSVPGVIALLLVPTFLVVWFGRRPAFPAKR